jgi:hypothetical protein
MLQTAATIGVLQPGSRVQPVQAGEEHTSGTLHRCLMTIINDLSRHARVRLTAGQIHFGVFGDWQALNAVNALRVNEDAPGMGVAIAFHEIWENYASRNDRNERGRYGPAHASALAMERDIATELTGREGGRVAAVPRVRKAEGAEEAEKGMEGEGEKSSKAEEVEEPQAVEEVEQGWVLDYEDYFLVLTTRPVDQRDNGRFDAAIREREHIADEVVDGLTAGQRVAADRISGFLDTLREHPEATAKVSGQRTADEDPALAGLRATAVRSALAHGLDPEEDYAAQENSITLARGDDTLGSLRVWAGPEEVVGASPGARIEIDEPEAPEEEDEEAERD